MAAYVCMSRQCAWREECLTHRPAPDSTTVLRLELSDEEANDCPYLVLDGDVEEGEG